MPVYFKKITWTKKFTGGFSLAKFSFAYYYTLACSVYLIFMLSCKQVPGTVLLTLFMACRTRNWNCVLKQEIPRKYLMRLADTRVPSQKTYHIMWKDYLLSNQLEYIRCARRLQDATLQYAKLLQSCPALWDPIDCSPPGSSVHRILQVRIQEWVARPSSRGSSQPRDWTCLSCVSCTGKWLLQHSCHLGSPMRRYPSLHLSPSLKHAHKH